MGLRPAKFHEKLRQAQGIPGRSRWFFDPVIPRKTLAGVAVNALLDGEAVRRFYQLHACVVMPNSNGIRNAHHVAMAERENYSDGQARAG
jgi:hypothetical protein